MDKQSFVEKIDLVLMQRNQKRQTLAEACGFSPQAISDWSKRGSYPSAHIALKIANFLEVSIEWLLNDEYEALHSNFEEQEQNEVIRLSSKDIMFRIEIVLSDKTKIDYHQNDERLYEPILDIVSINEIRAFKQFHLEPTIKQLYRIAERLNVSIDWLITERSDENITTANISIYRIAMQNSSHIYNFNNLYKTDQKIVEELTSKLFESRRKIRERMQELGMDVTQIPEIWK